MFTCRHSTDVHLTTLTLDAALFRTEERLLIQRAAFSSVVVEQDISYVHSQVFSVVDGIRHDVFVGHVPGAEW